MPRLLLFPNPFR